MQGVSVERKNYSGQCMLVFWDSKVRKKRIGARSQCVERELDIRKGFIYMEDLDVFIVREMYNIYSKGGGKLLFIKVYQMSVPNVFRLSH